MSGVRSGTLGLYLRLALVAGVVSAACGWATQARAEHIYFSAGATNTVNRVDIDGTNQQVTAYATGHPWALAVDRDAGKLYWTCSQSGRIQRANLDGTNVEDLVTSGLVQPTGIDLDLVHGKMYWADHETGKLQRADLDGSNVEDLLTVDPYGPFGIALDVEGGKMYWTNFLAYKIQRADLDGGNVEDLVAAGTGGPCGIALDLFHGKIYWTSTKIKRANLDGSNVEDVVSTIYVLEAVAIDLDVADDKLYWARTINGNLEIHRHRLDGSEGVVVLSTPGSTQGLSLSLRPGDTDRDGDVDLNDYTVFSDCLSGPGGTPSPVLTTLEKCLYVCDFDGDGDVDSFDYADLLQAFSY